MYALVKADNTDVYAWTRAECSPQAKAYSVQAHSAIYNMSTKENTKKIKNLYLLPRVKKYYTYPQDQAFLVGKYVFVGLILIQLTNFNT